MEVGKKRIRLDFAPLNIAISMTVLTEGSPLTQVYNGSSSQWEPNRTLTPTVIWPEVTLAANDGSLAGSYGNERLAQVQWFVDGEDITTLDDWTGLYEIVTSGEYKGALKIYRNLDPEEQYALRLTAVVNDARTDTNYPVVTDTVIISCIDMGESTFKLEVDTSPWIPYNQFIDDLFNYEYEVAHGITAEDATVREQFADCNCYRKDMPVALYRGTSVYEGDWDLKLYYNKGFSSGVLQLEEITSTDDTEFEEISTERIVLDMRLVETAEYVVKAFVDGSEVAGMQFGAKRDHNPYKLFCVNGSPRRATDSVRSDRAQGTTNNRPLPHPANVLRIIWKTDSEKYTGKVQGEGERVLYTVESTGAGSTQSTGWIDQYMEVDYKDPHAIAVDDEGNLWTDENGNPYIFN